MATIDPLTTILPGSPDSSIAAQTRLQKYNQATLARLAHLVPLKDKINEIIASMTGGGYQGTILGTAANMPVAEKDWYWIVSTDGQIGTDGPLVEAGDQLIAVADNATAGIYSVAGTNFMIVEKNIAPSTDTQLQAGTSDEVYVTPLTLADQGFVFTVGNMQYNGEVWLSDAAGTGNGVIHAIDDQDLFLYGGNSTAAAAGMVSINGGVASEDFNGGAVEINGSDAAGTTGTGTNGGYVTISTGDGGDTAIAGETAGNSGALTLVTGDGGAATNAVGGAEVGGNSGAVSINSGNGGAIDDASVGTGGNAGNISIRAGAGGDANNAGATAGTGGNVVISGGDAGGSTGGTAGTAGAIFIDAGDPNGGTGTYVSIGADYAGGVYLGGETSNADVVAGDLATAYTGAELANYSNDGNKVVHVARVTYDFAEHGGVAGPIGLGVYLPDNAVVTRSWYEVITEIDSAGGAATIQFGIIGSTSMFAGASVGDPIAGLYDGDIDGVTAVEFAKTTAVSQVAIEIGTENITAGKAILFLEYVITE